MVSLSNPPPKRLDKETIYGQGFHVIAPWNDMHVYNVKIQENYEAMEVLSKNGLSIKIDLSFRYNAIDNKIGYLHDNIGKSYVNSIVKPEIRSVTREVIGNYLPEELYSSKREGQTQSPSSLKPKLTLFSQLSVLNLFVFSLSFSKLG
jgi:regulator of protease activity HflC (stomatin/prohibitin superfamily)